MYMHTCTSPFLGLVIDESTDVAVYKKLLLGIYMYMYMYICLVDTVEIIILWTLLTERPKP